MAPRDGIHVQDSRLLAETMYRIGDELAHSAKTCVALQWSISALLDKVHHPDLGAEMHMLQDIDRLHQTLTDLAFLSQVIAGLSEDFSIPYEPLIAAPKLESLRQRLFVEETPAADASGHDDETEITWF